MKSLKIIATYVGWTQSFMHSFKLYLFRTSRLPDIISGARDIRVNNESKVPALLKTTFYWGRKGDMPNIQIDSMSSPGIVKQRKLIDRNDGEEVALLAWIVREDLTGDS